MPTFGDSLRRYVQEMLPKLEQRFQSREDLLLLSREVIRYAGEAISLSHRGKREEAVQKFDMAKSKLREVSERVKAFPDLLHGDVGTAYQEVSEAAAVLSMYFDLPLPSPEELGVPEGYYVLGMADAVGEMRRMALELLRKGKKEEAERVYQTMEEVYGVLWDLEYPKALVPNLRQKIDYMRRIIEETHHDIFIAEAMR
jgi:Predicted RNA-binding protein of the translin family